MAEYCGTAEAVALNSGTDALLLAMMVAGIGKGDEVITPPNSFVASTATIVQLGATPVFADVLADQNIDPEKIAKAITPRTKAIMPVHLTGRICQMDEIMEIANRHGLVVIEDAAQAIGSMYKGRLARLDRPLRLLLRASAQEPERAGRRRLRHHQRQGGGRAHAPPARARHGRPPDHRGMGHGLAHGHAAGGDPQLPPRQAARRDRQAARQCGSLPEAPASRADVRADLPQRGVQHLPHLRRAGRQARRAAGASQGDRGIKTAIHYPVPDPSAAGGPRASATRRAISR